MDIVKSKITSQRLRTDAVLKRVESISLDDQELRSDGARYLCIILSGFLESAVRLLVLSYINRVSHPRIHRYAARRLNRSTNYNAEKLIQEITSLDPDWGREISEYIKDDKKAAIDSIISLRNQVAHGESTGVSISTIKVYYYEIIDVVNLLTDMLVTRHDR